MTSSIDQIEHATRRHRQEFVREYVEPLRSGADPKKVSKSESPVYVSTCINEMIEVKWFDKAGVDDKNKKACAKLLRERYHIYWNELMDRYMKDEPEITKLVAKISAPKTTKVFEKDMSTLANLLISYILICVSDMFTNMFLLPTNRFNEVYKHCLYTLEYQYGIKWANVRELYDKDYAPLKRWITSVDSYIKQGVLFGEPLVDELMDRLKQASQ